MDITVDISKVVLETDRLLLRGWREKDVDDFFEYASVDGVGEMAGWKHHETLETTRQILHGFIREKNGFPVVNKDNDKVIGSLGLHESWANGDDRAKNLKVKEIGYVLSKAYWGNGLMPEAVKAVMAFCFERCGLEALTCSHFETNSQSKRVIEKCGFSYVGNSEFFAKQLQKRFQNRNYIVLRSDWTAPVRIMPK